MNDIEIIEEFEKRIAEYTGSKYAVAVSSGTNAIFLSLLWQKHIGVLKDGDIIFIPKNTYMSVPMSILNAGLKVQFEDIPWTGSYRLKPTWIIDSACRLTQGMIEHDMLTCISFQYRKILKLGRGGMVLTNEPKAVEYLKMARHNGKHPGVSKHKDVFEITGWDMYMTPSQAALGLSLFQTLKEQNDDCANYFDYPDLSKQEIFK